MADLQGQLGVATCCGCCAETAGEYLPGGRYAGQATVKHEAGTLLANAANDPGVAVAAPMIAVAVRRA